MIFAYHDTISRLIINFNSCLSCAGINIQRNFRSTYRAAVARTVSLTQYPLPVQRAVHCGTPVNTTNGGKVAGKVTTTRLHYYDLEIRRQYIQYQMIENKHFT